MATEQLGRSMEFTLDVGEDFRNSLAGAAADKLRIDWLQTKECGIDHMGYGDYVEWHNPCEDEDIRATIDEAMSNERTENGS